MRLFAKALLIIGILLASGGMGAAAVITGAEPEQLVEGHTVFTVIEQLPQVCPPEDPNCEPPTEYAAAVAVLVREVQLHNDDITTRFPGVLWFNDQYLVNPRSGKQEAVGADTRYPCTGAVIATLDGAPVPPLTDPTAYNDLNYVESYAITPPDPFIQTWFIDKWNINGELVWTVALNRNDAGYATPDSGTGPSCATSGVNSCYLEGPQLCWRTLWPSQVPSTSQDAANFPCSTCDPIEYNALLYFRLSDLGPQVGVKNHTAGSTDYTADYAACHDTAPTGAHKWPCPAGDDNREGNSHRYNGAGGWPIQNGVAAAHGGSADCTGDTVPDEDCHGTYNIMVYYGVAAEPTARTLAVSDFDNAALYHCHEPTKTGWCNKAESPLADAPVLR